jgi:hypothetical protein
MLVTLETLDRWDTVENASKRLLEGATSTLNKYLNCRSRKEGRERWITLLFPFDTFANL